MNVKKPELNLKNFEAIDSSGKSKDFIDALIAFNTAKEIQALKNLAKSKINPKKNLQLLDAGCGIGLETIALAKQFPQANCIGIDISEELLKTAQQRAEQESLSIQFKKMDIEKLNFPDNTFDYTRAERMLLYVSSPQQALSELRRVTKPGGTICLIEPDWETNTINLADRALVRKILHHDCDHNIRNAWIGRELPSLLKAVGLNHYEIDSRVVIIPSQLAAQFYQGIANAAYESNVINQEELQKWQAMVSDLLTNNEIFCTISYFLYSCQN